MCLNEDTELLGTSECEYRDEYLAAAIYTVEDLRRNPALARSFAVANSCGVGGFRDENVWTEAIDPCGSEMAIGSHVVIASVDNRFVAHACIKHCCAKHMSGIVWRQFQGFVHADRLVQADAITFFIQAFIIAAVKKLLSPRRSTVIFR